MTDEQLKKGTEIKDRIQLLNDQLNKLKEVKWNNQGSWVDEHPQPPKIGIYGTQTDVKVAITRSGSIPYIKDVSTTVAGAFKLLVDAIRNEYIQEIETLQKQYDEL